MSIIDQIHNYYEHKVIESINVHAVNRNFTQEQLVDLTCLALNNLPTRYYRHEVDLAFYMSAQEHEEINSRVEIAVKGAISYLETQREK